jgi:hypothetical protein
MEVSVQPHTPREKMHELWGEKKKRKEHQGKAHSVSVVDRKLKPNFV